MVNATLDQELHEQLERLSPNQQREVVDFARSLVPQEKPRGVGANLLKYAGTISEEDVAAMQQSESVRGRGVDLMPLVGSISKEDLFLMKQAIEEGCEQIDLSDW